MIPSLLFLAGCSEIESNPPVAQSAPPPEDKIVDEIIARSTDFDGFGCDDQKVFDSYYNQLGTVVRQAMATRLGNKKIMFPGCSAEHCFGVQYSIVETYGTINKEEKRALADYFSDGAVTKLMATDFYTERRHRFEDETSRGSVVKNKEVIEYSLRPAAFTVYLHEAWEENFFLINK